MLFLSRIRELFADESSAQTTHDPIALSTALIKISYGLAKCQDQLAQEHWAEAAGNEKDKKREKQHSPVTSARIAALGIANAGDARGFALSTSNAMRDFSEAAMANALQWEFTNPWARWFQLLSTHPLTARRVHLMNETAKRMGIKPLYDLSITASDHRQDISKFVREFLIYSLPFLSAMVSVAVGISKIGIHSWSDLAPYALIGYGLGWFVKTACIYPSRDARQYTVEELVGKEINASPVKAVPCIIEGRIIGRGMPGLFWSDDLVLPDGTGFLRLQYRQPLGIFEFLFGWLKAGRYIGREAIVYGWYRRALSHYVEISHIKMKNNLGDNVRCYYMWVSYVIATLFVLVGFALLILL